VELDASRIAELAGRPIGALTRRDVAFGLLGVGADDALASLPMLRRRLLAAGNPLSAAFWGSAEAILAAIRDGVATTGDVREWLEATGTEPSGMIGLHVWDEAPERSPLQAETHALLVGYLEEQVAAGQIDPDRLVTGDSAALRAHAQLQERWMTSPLADGRVPMDTLLDEKDAEFLAEWAAADADALNALRGVLDEVGERPLAAEELAEACQAARAAITRRDLTGRLLAACGGGERLPSSDTDLWLTLAAGVISPAGEAIEPAGEQAPGDDGLDEVSRAMAALCALEHVDWLAAVSALARGGPGTPASADDMARYVRDYCEAGADDLDDDEFGDDDFDESAIAELFTYVAQLWNVLGATDAADRLTPLGWWGVPEALLKVWAAPG
jgi:hypothetical protein